ncbi:MAG: Fe-S cluster assembly protein SufD [Chloroflexota bacterium]
MAQKTIAPLDRYTVAFERLRHGGPDWLRALRQQAFDRFQALGFPTARKGNEAWKYTDIRPIANESFEYSQPQPTRRTSFSVRKTLPFDEGFARIAIVDGQFAAEHSSGLDTAGIRAMSLAAAIEEEPEILQRYIGRVAKWEEDAFLALNTAFIHDGVFIRVTQPVQQPVHIVYATASKDPLVTYPRTLLLAQANTSVTVVETFISLGEQKHFTDSVTEFVLGEGASVDHYRLLMENHEAFHIGATSVYSGKDSTFNSLSYVAGGGLSRNDVHVLLDAPGAATDLRGLYITSGTQHVDNNIVIDHAKPNGTSRLYYKGILDDKSKAVFGGNVYVRKDAQKTDAHQRDKNLLLSSEAEVDSKPSLEIYADDVKAGHGATAGALTDEAMFYLQSRGLDQDTAMRFLVRGFAAEILDTITVDALREWLEERAMQALPRFRQEEVLA